MEKRVRECDRGLEKCARLGKENEEYTKWLEECAKKIKPELQFFKHSVVHTAHEVKSCYPKDSKYYELEKIILNSGKLQWNYENGGFKDVTLAPARLVAQTILWDLYTEYEEGFLPEIFISAWGGINFEWNCCTLRVHSNGKVSFYGEEMIEPTLWRFVRERCIEEIILFCNPRDNA